MSKLALAGQNDIWLWGIMILTILFLLLVIRRSAWGSFLISIYLAFAVTVKSVSFFFKSPLAEIIYFAVIGIVLFSIFKQSFRLRVGGKKIWLWIKMTLLSLTSTGLLASIVLSWYADFFKKSDFSDFLLQGLISTPAQLFWIVMPLVLLIIFRKKN